MDNLQLTIELKVIDTLREQFPQERFYNQVSLKLIGRIGDDDIRFLSGYSGDSELDEDTGEILYKPEKHRWNTLDLDLSDINPEDFKDKSLNQIKALRSIILPKGYENVEWRNFWEDANNTTSSLLISEGTNAIKGDSFNGWEMLKSVSLPSTLVKIAPEAFVGCDSLKAFVFPEGSDHLKVCDGVLFSLDGLMLIAFPPGLEREEYVIPEGTTIIAERAFKHNPHIKKVIIPPTVVQIQAYAFENCTSLKQIEVNPANHIYKSSNGILIEKNVPVLVPFDGGYSHERTHKILCIPAAFDKEKLGIKEVLLAYNCFAGCRFIKALHFNGGTIKPDISGAFDSANNIEELTLEKIKEMPDLTWCKKLKILNVKGYISGSIKDSVVSRYNVALKAVNIEEDMYRENQFYSVDGVVFSKDHELYFTHLQKKMRNMSCRRILLISAIGLTLMTIHL